MYGVLGFVWAGGGPGFPFGRAHDPEAEHTLLAGATTGDAPLIAALGLIGCTVALAMARARGRGPARVAMLGFAWTAAAALALVVTDVRLLMLVTRIVVTPLFVFTGVPGGGSVADFYTWPRLNLFVLVAGGALWGFTALAYQRRTRSACGNCGRNGQAIGGWTTPESAQRWGRWAVWVAAAIPAIYAVSRIAMALGNPVGMPQEFYDDMAGTGLWIGALVMALLATVAAVLTVGLCRPWGEVFPRWLWFAAGRPVPPRVALIPATVFAVFISAAGVTEARLLVVDGFDTHEWGITGPTALWPLWGPALGIATHGYYLRRRDTCRMCHGGAVADGGASVKFGRGPGMNGSSGTQTTDNTEHRTEGSTMSTLINSTFFNLSGQDEGGAR